MQSNIQEQLRAAARKSGMSMLQLAEQSGLRYASVHAFVAKRKGLTLASGAKLAALLGLELRPVRRRKTKLR